MVHLDAAKSFNTAAARNVAATAATAATHTTPSAHPNLPTKAEQPTNAAAAAASAAVKYVTEDCLTFLRRELRRQCAIRGGEGGAVPAAGYDGLILDPPAFGRGGRGGNKTWQIERDLPTLLTAAASLLSPQPVLVLLSSHDVRWPAERLGQQLHAALQAAGVGGGMRAGLKMQTGQMLLKPRPGGGGRPLPMGSYARWSPSSL